MRLPVCIVYGNCQGPALAEVLRASPAFAAEYEVAHVPAVHTITSAQRAELEQLVGRAALIVAQPVKSGFRKMQLGTDEITAAAPTGCRIIRWPVLFYQALFPYQAYVSFDGRRVNAPFTGAYHDLRVVSCAARGMGLEDGVDWLGSYVPEEATLRDIVAMVFANVRERERSTDIAVFDRVTASSDSHGASFFTVNHPSRLTLRYVSEAVHGLLDLPFDDVGTGELLGTIKTPVEGAVANVLGLPGNGVPAWVINEERIPMETVFRAQLEFYRERPEVVASATEKHEARLANLGLVHVSDAPARIAEDDDGSFD